MLQLNLGWLSWISWPRVWIFTIDSSFWPPMWLCKTDIFCGNCTWGRCIYADPVANVFDSGIPGGKSVWTEGLQPVDASELERGLNVIKMEFSRGSHRIFDAFLLTRWDPQNPNPDGPDKTPMSSFLEVKILTRWKLEHRNNNSGSMFSLIKNESEGIEDDQMPFFFSHNRGRLSSGIDDIVLTAQAKPWQPKTLICLPIISGLSIF